MSEELTEVVRGFVKALAAGAAAFASALGAVPTANDGGGGRSVPTVAPDSELDSQFGNPEVRRDPKDKYWQGPSYVGQHFSECPPDYLDAMAKYKDASAYMNEKGGKAKYAEYDRRDAARARGWAARLRAGWKPKTNGVGGGQPVSDADYGDGADDDLPF